MIDAFDPRIIRLTIEIDGSTQTYDGGDGITQGYHIRASGTKMVEEMLPEADIQIFNLKRETRDYLVTQTTPYKIDRKFKHVVLEVGRKSYGTFILFEGEVFASNPTQPPDIGLTLKAVTGASGMFSVGSWSGKPVDNLHSIAKNTAKSIPAPPTPGQIDGAQGGGIYLDMQAPDQNIANYQYNGSASGQIRKLNEVAGVQAYMDNRTLIVKARDKALNGDPIVINKDTGMIGVPETTQTGVRVKFLINNNVRVGCALKVESDLNPAANGTFMVWKLNFDVASRDTPFYYVAECVSEGIFL